MTDLDPRTTALLVMDYQPGILGRLADPDPMVARTAGAIALMRRHGAAVGYVRVAFTDADLAAMPPTSGMAARAAAAGRSLHADAPETAIDERVAPEAGDIVVRKTRVGAFSTTDLDAQLRSGGITTLVLAGVSTSGVVLSTVRDGFDRDYRLLVLADGCGDPEDDVHAFLVERVLARQARVIAAAELEGLL